MPVSHQLVSVYDRWFNLERNRLLVSTKTLQKIACPLNSCEGTLFRASQFLSEELPVRLAHRVEELGKLPDGLSDMTAIQRVRDWYAQSFEEITELARPNLDKDTKDRLLNPPKKPMPSNTRNPSIKSSNTNDLANRRYFAAIDDGRDWPPELNDYNRKFARTLEMIKKRHDPVVDNCCTRYIGVQA